ncbi:MAG: FAD:protein FMN transferase, partial [Chloroflexi bacterium]|nr:FAD:protein FMN transferase [Chloroflexota bacterium]
MAALRFEALGSDCELYAVAPREQLAATAEWIHALHARLTRFDPGSELSRFNARAGEWTDVSKELEALLRAALDAFETSAGLVHAGILPALVAAGYDRTFSEVGPTATAAVATALAPLTDLLEVRPGSARLARGAALDLG